jgi:hypothetical protein
MGCTFTASWLIVGRYERADDEADLEVLTKLNLELLNEYLRRVNGEHPEEA